jgi:hypothetical protein
LTARFRRATGRASAFPLATFIVHLCCWLLEARTRHSFSCRSSSADTTFFSCLCFTNSIDTQTPQYKLTFTVSLHIFHLPVQVPGDTTCQIMNVRKIIESYEQEKISAVSNPPPRTAAFRSRPRPRPRTQSADTSLIAPNQRSLRTPRPSSLKTVKEERPVTVILKVRLHFLNLWCPVDHRTQEWVNELQVEQRTYASHFSIPLCVRSSVS